MILRPSYRLAISIVSCAVVFFSISSLAQVGEERAARDSSPNGHVDAVGDGVNKVRGEVYPLTSPPISAGSPDSTNFSPLTRSRDRTGADNNVTDNEASRSLGACPVADLRNAWAELAPLERSAIESEVLRLCTARAEAIAKVLRGAADIRVALGSLASAAQQVRDKRNVGPRAFETAAPSLVGADAARDPSLRDIASGPEFDDGFNDGVGDGFSQSDQNTRKPDPGKWEILYTVRAGNGQTTSKQTTSKQTGTKQIGTKQTGSQWVAKLRRVGLVADLIDTIVPGAGSGGTGLSSSSTGVGFSGTAGPGTNLQTTFPTKSRTSPSTSPSLKPSLKPRETKLVRRGDLLDNNVRVVSVGPNGVQTALVKNVDHNLDHNLDQGRDQGTNKNTDDLNTLEPDTYTSLPWAKVEASSETAGGADWIVEKVTK